MECGIVGLPNVGKSTLFNALTATASAQAANYPFCTIEPNVGTVCVPDSRLQILQALNQSQAVVPTQLSFVDIAGLVKGASTGAGLGNKFLAHIRNCDAIIHVVRCFSDPDVIHVSGQPDPISDIEIIETELMLADLQSVEQRLSKKKIEGDVELLKKIHTALCKGKWASSVLDAFDIRSKGLNLLTLKPVMYVANIADAALAAQNPESQKDNQWLQAVYAMGAETKRPVVMACAQLESELSLLDTQERKELMIDIGLHHTGLDQIIRNAYEMLNLITFFTAGPKETRAWTVKKGAKAPEAAGVIHGDFQRGFIRAETVGYQDLVDSGSLQKAKESGKLRSEGKEYVVTDGDVILFRFNV